MRYNQKVWLGVLVFCTLFWLAVASGIYSLSKKTEKHLQEHTVKKDITSPKQAF
ncbi:hypothetical protein FHU10_3811 [Serratia fonticola]|jgi:hypothetical protein|uniref:Uncharacterized protein n=1 Tax=Serratia fonticola TaxID=47917 RepID=A0A542BRU5_SERFO|nr:hypothetical protein [Serratia fonticola]TQI81280.1 hypothetical protein FHU09_3896 [Serratia fonticola]TQI96696.1 hypothetical protein FHU11_2150 [Serratia fonticola]TVZ71193.1 hypothetical protein FHU10_3811 [Serratia fonticola]